MEESTREVSHLDDDFLVTLFGLVPSLSPRVEIPETHPSIRIHFLDSEGPRHPHRGLVQATHVTRDTTQSEVTCEERSA